jgi:hypothetical protein
MTDDLVKRLRRADTCIFPTERDRCHCGEAADRILKLEAALAHIYAWYPINVAGPLQTVHEIRDFARKALEATK